jgi:hypothetical protein
VLHKRAAGHGGPCLPHCHGRKMFRGGQTHVAINGRAGDPTTLAAACINEMKASFR